MLYSVTSTSTAYSAGTKLSDSSGNRYIGYSYDSLRTVRYQFTTGSDGAASITFSFNGPTNPTAGSTGSSIAASINWYVTDSETSHINATSSYPKHGTCSASLDQANYRYDIGVSGGSVKLLPNTTYYLWLFPNHDNSDSNYGYYLTINNSYSTSMSITLDGEYKPYTLTLNKGPGTNLEVYKDGSALSSGDTVYTGDVIQVWYNASTGYTNESCSVSSVGSVSNGGTFAVSTNHTITTSAEVVSYLLSIIAANGSAVTVNRSSSPLKGAETGELKNEATIYYNDVLTITFAALPGYELVTTTVNGSDFTSEDIYTVTSAVIVETTTKQLGLVYIDNGSGFKAYLVYIDNGLTWDQYAPYIDNGTSWDLFS